MYSAGSSETKQQGGGGKDEDAEALKSSISKLKKQLETEVKLKEELQNQIKASTTKLESASRDMEADRKSRLAKETEFGQLQRDNALLQHKLSDSQRRADLEAEKRKKMETDII